MPDIVGIIFGVASLHDLVADLKERFLKLRYAFAGFDLDVHSPGAEFLPEIGIGYQPARLLVRKPRALGHAAKGVIHRPVQ